MKDGLALSSVKKRFLRRRLRTGGPGSVRFELVFWSCSSGTGSEDSSWESEIGGSSIVLGFSWSLGLEFSGEESSETTSLGFSEVSWGGSIFGVDGLSRDYGFGLWSNDTIWTHG